MWPMDTILPAYFTKLHKSGNRLCRYRDAANIGLHRLVQWRLDRRGKHNIWDGVMIVLSRMNHTKTLDLTRSWAPVWDWIFGHLFISLLRVWKKVRRPQVPHVWQAKHVWMPFSRQSNGGDRLNSYPWVTTRVSSTGAVEGYRSHQNGVGYLKGLHFSQHGIIAIQVKSWWSVLIEWGLFLVYSLENCIHFGLEIFECLWQKSQSLLV